MDSITNERVTGRFEMQPRPLECLHEPRVPPFLCKTFDIVDDPLLDGVISWAPAGNSFVVWNPPQFERTILPTHFKHANFSSFVRQLNTYGFRKTNTDRWEFANEDFLRGSKHLLKNINRRRSQGGPHFDCTSLEIIKPPPNVEAEVQNLKREKNMLLQEVSMLRQENSITLQQMNSLNQKIESADQRQKQLVSFLAKIIQNPAFTARIETHQQQRMRRKFLTHQQSDLGQSSSPKQEQNQCEDKELKIDMPVKIEEPFYREMELRASTSTRSLKGKDAVQVQNDAFYMISDQPWSCTGDDLTQVDLIDPAWDLDLHLDTFEDLELFNI